MINRILIGFLLLFIGFFAGQNYKTINAINLEQVLATKNSQLGLAYSNLVSHYYEEVLNKTINMNQSIDAFLSDPSIENLEYCKQNWIEAREVYGITEAFRFYGGPIDGVNQFGEEGPEGLINSWPLNEAHIDYVRGNPEAGLINNLAFEINAESIVSSNQTGDDADVSTGWHAIEFLLWGQDHSLETAGTRSHEDYLPGINNNDRRRAYLSESSQMLLAHIKWLNDQWDKKGAGRIDFMSREDIGGNILTGIATLAGFELSSERIATALDSGDPEDEHSCFSDQTHKDIIANFNGIKNVYLGLGINGEKFSPSISDIVQEKDPDLNKKILILFNNTMNEINNITVPFDKMLSEPHNSSGKQAAENTVSNLLLLAENFKDAGNILDWRVIIAE